MTDGVGIVGLGSTVLVVVVTCALIACSRSFGRKLGSHFAIDVVVCFRLAAEGIIRLAARRLPENERERYEEEWLAELEELRRSYAEEPTWSLVVFALRVLLRARTMGKVWAEHASALSKEPHSSHAKRRQGRMKSVSPFFVSILGYALRFRTTRLTASFACTAVPMIFGPRVAVRWTLLVLTFMLVVSELVDWFSRRRTACRPKKGDGLAAPLGLKGSLPACREGPRLRAGGRRAPR